MIFFKLRYAALCAAAIFTVSSLLPLAVSKADTVPAAVRSAAAHPVSVQTVSIEHVDTPEAVPANVRLDTLSINMTVARPLEQAVVTSRFGFRDNPVSGEYKFHTGIDLAAPEGESIYALLGGVVSTARFDEGYGNFVVIDHESGLQTLYAHCSELLCEVGDTVDIGQEIALVGSTGNSTGAHLHFEVRLGGIRYDPEGVVGEMYA